MPIKTRSMTTLRVLKPTTTSCGVQTTLSFAPEDSVSFINEKRKYDDDDADTEQSSTKRFKTDDHDYQKPAPQYPSRVSSDHAKTYASDIEFSDSDEEFIPSSSDEYDTDEDEEDFSDEEDEEDEDEDDEEDEEDEEDAEDAEDEDCVDLDALMLPKHWRRFYSMVLRKARKKLHEDEDDEEDFDFGYETETESEPDETGHHETDTESSNRDGKSATTPKPVDEEAKRHRQYVRTLDSEERKFFKGLPMEEQQRIVAMERTIGDLTKKTIPLRFQILQSHLDDYTKSIALGKIDMMNQIEETNGEYMKIMNWIHSLCRIPIGTYRQLEVDDKSTVEDVSKFINNTAVQLDEHVYGHTKAKDQIIRILAQWISNPSSKGNVIGIQGSPGVGKTTLIKECVCKALNIPFAFIPLGGASDGSFLDGHGYTYEGAIWGKIVDCLMKAQCMNPVLYFDELDKVSDTGKGQEIINILIHLTDPSQNEAFSDKYFSDIKLDLSRCLIVFTYNNADEINPILKDRMITITTDDYTNMDKLQISKNHIIPETLRQFNFQLTDIIVPDEIIQQIIQRTEKEAGVRNLKRSFELLISNINLVRLLFHNNPTECTKFKDLKTKILRSNDDSVIQFPMTITTKLVDTFVTDVVRSELHHHLYT